MAITVNWEDDEKRIIRQTFEGAWSWQEFIDSCTNGNAALMKTVTHTVHIISDFTPSGPLPLGGGAISQSRNVMKNYPENWGIIVIVSGSMFVRSLVMAFRRAYPRGYGAKTFAASSLDEAHAIIRRFESERAVVS